MNLLKQIQDRVDDILDYFGHYYFHMIVLMHVIYIFVFIGIIAINSIFLKTFNILIQSFVCVFLMFRFHPFRKHRLREYDANIIFGSAGFLLFNMIFVEFFSVYKFPNSSQTQSNNTTDKPANKLLDNAEKSDNPIIRGLIPLQFQ
jgi:hypothetical protein